MFIAFGDKGLMLIFMATVQAHGTGSAEIRGVKFFGRVLKSVFHFSAEPFSVNGGMCQ
jgi:hypothetical protein